MSSKTNTKTKSKTNSLLKTKTKLTKHSKTKHSKTKNRKNNKKPHNIDKYCKYYKNDINGKPNKNLYNSCKINKYCRKYKCQNIDVKLLQAKQKHIGQEYNKIIFNKIKSSCPENILEDDILKNNKKQKNCINKATKQIYKEYNLDNIYKKSLECDNVICKKEQNIFNINLFRQKQIKLKKKSKKNIKLNYKSNYKSNHKSNYKLSSKSNNNNFENEVDHYLIERGDL